MIEVKGELKNIHLNKITIKTRNEKITLPVRSAKVTDLAMQLLTGENTYANYVVISVEDGEIINIVGWVYIPPTET